MEKIIEIISIAIIFVIDRYIAYRWVNMKHFPQWLDYKPFNCELCFTFWSLLIIYICIGWLMNWYVTMIGGIVLTILNAIAMWRHQKNNTINLDEYDNLK